MYFHSEILGHVRMQGLNAAGQSMTAKKNQRISSYETPHVAVPLFQLFSLGFGDSVLLVSSSPKSTD